MSDLREFGAAVARGVVPPDLADLERVAGASGGPAWSFP
jgi:hypothetical protein